jgi:hypothetical protein
MELLIKIKVNNMIIIKITSINSIVYDIVHFMQVLVYCFSYLRKLQ